MKKKDRTGKKPVLHANTRTDLLALIEEICRWLNGSYEPLPPDITLQVSPTDFASTAAGLSDEQLVAHARTLRGEARRVESALSKLKHDGRVTRIANNLKSLLYGLDDLLPKLK